MFKGGGDFFSLKFSDFIDEKIRSELPFYVISVSRLCTLVDENNGDRTRTQRRRPPITRNDYVYSVLF